MPNKLTEVELKIVDVLRELKPFETIEIHKDKMGKPDFYLVHREQKIVLQPGDIS
jgi:hypothetical protein